MPVSDQAYSTVVRVGEVPFSFLRLYTVMEKWPEAARMGHILQKYFCNCSVLEIRNANISGNPQNSSNFSWHSIFQRQMVGNMITQYLWNNPTSFLFLKHFLPFILFVVDNNDQMTWHDMHPVTLHPWLVPRCGFDWQHANRWCFVEL